MALNSINTVGRVGALAVALGAGMLLAPAIAAADDSTTTETSTTDDAARPPGANGAVHSGRRGPTHPAATVPSTRARGVGVDAEDSIPRAVRSSALTDPTVAFSPSDPVASIPVTPPNSPLPQLPFSVPTPQDPLSTTGEPAAALPEPGPVSIQLPGTSSAPDVVVAQRVSITVPVDTPVMTATPRPAASGAVSGLTGTALAWLGANGTPGAPSAAALAWATAAVTRRELEASPAASTVASVTTSQPANAIAADPIGDFVRLFIGNGTADHPDAGLLIGNGFSYTAATCTGTTACNGGKAGLIGNGGSGFNGGKGGAATWFGNGGAGGDGRPGQKGGTGGIGGLFLGNGGSGGNGGTATAVAGNGGDGGAGGNTGLLSVWGSGGKGGSGGNGAGSFYNGGNGGSGGAGGQGGWVLGQGGDGGNGGNGAGGTDGGADGTGGKGGSAGSGRVLFAFAKNGAPGTDGLAGVGCGSLRGAGSGCAAPVSRVFAPYIDMGSIAQREQTWYMSDTTDPTKPVPSLVATMEKTGIQAATLAFVNQQGSGGALVWGSSKIAEQNIAVTSPTGVQMRDDIKAAMDKGLDVIVSFGGITACQNGVEIGQINGKAATASSSPVKGTGSKSVTMTLSKPIDLSTMEAGSISGRFMLNGAVTDLYTVDKTGTFTFTHQATYQVPKATGGTLAPDGGSITLTFDDPVTSNYGDASTDVSYGLQDGYLAMKKAYQDAIGYFYSMGIRHFDLDIEGPALEIGQWGINNQRNRVFKAFQEENTFPDMELSYVLPMGPNTGWHPVTNPGRLIQSAGQIGLKVSTWNMMAFDYGPASYQYMLANKQNMVDMLIGEADTGITVDPNFPIDGAVDYLVKYGLATDRADAFQKLGVTLMIGQDDTLYEPGYTPTGFTSGDAATVEAITPVEVGGTDPAAKTVLNWARNNGVGLLSFWSLGRDRPSYNTTAYNPNWLVTYQTGSPAAGTLETTKVASGGGTTVDLPFGSSTRTIKSGTVFDGGGNWLGSFKVRPDTTLDFYSVPSLSTKPVGGKLDTATGTLRVDFNGNVTGTVWSRMDLDPKILAEYQDKDLVYTAILNAFDG